MLFDIKKLFTKDSTLGRFEYLKVALGLLLFPMLIIQLAISTPPNSLLFYFVSTLAIITLVAYWIILWVATLHPLYLLHEVLQTKLRLQGY